MKLITCSIFTCIFMNITDNQLRFSFLKGDGGKEVKKKKMLKESLNFQL